MPHFILREWHLGKCELSDLHKLVAGEMHA